MEWIINNWFVVVSVAVAAVVAVFIVIRFFCIPNDKQKAKVKEWLIWACIEAEKALKTGTGQLKLREVWNSFVMIPSFSFIAKIVSFEVFETWVAESLDIAKGMLINNPTLAEYVYGEKYEEEIKKIKSQLAKEALPE